MKKLISRNPPKTKANMFNEQFFSVFSDPSGTYQGTLNEKTKVPSMEKIKVTENGVQKLMSNLNDNKATGADGVPSKILKLCSSELAPVFTLLFQASLEQGKVPDDWKTANIVPIHKKGSKFNPENYRPISLTSITCKLLEHIIASSMMRHFDFYKVLADCQHGFRSKRSCESQLITTSKDFIDCLENQGQIDAILLDFSKAFDKVHHGNLLLKLKHYGIHGSLFCWIKDFLSDRSQRVVLEGLESSPKPVLSGVPQGTVLGPLLFLVYINDMCEQLSPGTTLRLFADDSLLYRIIRSLPDAAALQKDLEILQNWGIDWKMAFHPQKCQVLNISNKKKIIINFNYNIHGIQLEKVPVAKYLGINIDSHLSWNNHIKSTAAKASSTLCFLQRHLKSCPPKVKEQCYNTYVRPTLEYACSVWDPYLKKDINKLEKVQRRAARFVTNNYDFKTDCSKILKDLNWTPLSERRAKIKTTLVYKAQNNLLHIPLNHLQSNSRNTRSATKNNYAVPRSQTNVHLHSFYPSTVRLWNSTPAEVRSSVSLEQFKNKLKNVTLIDKY